MSIAGKRLEAWRRQGGLSQSAAGKLVGVRQSTWSDWENGRTMPQMKQGVKVAEVTGGAVYVGLWGEAEEQATGTVG